MRDVWKYKVKVGWEWQSMKLVKGGQSECQKQVVGLKRNATKGITLVTKFLTYSAIETAKKSARSRAGAAWKVKRVRGEKKSQITVWAKWGRNSGEDWQRKHSEDSWTSPARLSWHLKDVNCFIAKSLQDNHFATKIMCWCQGWIKGLSAHGPRRPTGWGLFYPSFYHGIYVVFLWFYLMCIYVAYVLVIWLTRMGTLCALMDR